VNTQASPFHSGEHQLQEKFGVRKTMEQFGRRVIRDRLPEQHRDFYSQLPFLVLGFSDDEGWPWASIVAGEPGFIESPDDQTLQLSTELIPGDPLADHAQSGIPIGGLGIELHSRRRNRFSSTFIGEKEGHLQLEMKQTFGNCPQYIQAHQLSYSSIPADEVGQQENIKELNEADIELIENADMFFVASQTLGESGAAAGADVSHRGGRPGFVKVERVPSSRSKRFKHAQWRLTVPDYPGNNHFNTLGNFLLNPRAGLVFWDLKSRNLLMLTGEVEIIEDHPDIEFFQGAVRFWTFTIDSGIRLIHRLPLMGSNGAPSVNTEMTGTWEDVRLAKEAHLQRHSFMPYKVVSKKRESDDVISFELEPKQGRLPDFKAGQFLTLKLEPNTDKATRGKKQKSIIRSYTVSSAPGKDYFRISVKRQGPDNEGRVGEMSSYLHDILCLGDELEVKAPQGEFHWQDDSDRPVVMLAAGIGITPMIAMAQQSLIEQVSLRRFRLVTLIITARNKRNCAFYEELNYLASISNAYLRVYWCFTQAEEDLILGEEYQFNGRLTKTVIQSVLPLEDYDFYVCGPGGFMRDSYDVLKGLSVQGDRIYTEAFGPSSLLPPPETATSNEPSEASVTRAAVTFKSQDGAEHGSLSWTSDDGSLLSFSEAHGFEPEFGCRSGKCGSCKASLVKGSVVHDNNADLASINSERGELLLCCSRPSSDDVTIQF